MKIRQWLGYNEDASQYLLRPGELRILNNLQSRRPGMLISRKGLTKIYGKYDNETIYGLYRRATILGNPNDFLWLQKVLIEKELTAEQLIAQEYGFEYVWMIRRVEGNQSRIIDTLPIQPDGALAPITGMCVAEDRHERMFLFYGHGIRPRLYRPDNLGNVALPMGLDAPTASPSVLPSGTGFFIEGVDVKSGGGSYYEPPALTLIGGNPDRPAKLKAIVQTGNVVGVDIADGGANYKTTPRIEAAVDKVGSGFRARGNISGSARQVSGFNETEAGTISGTLAGPTQTYGATNGTGGNSILYLSRSPAVTERVISASGADLVLASVVGILAGDTVKMYPTAGPFNSPVTVVSVSTATNTVTLSASGFNPSNSTVYDATFRRPSTVGQVAAEYDPARRRFYATIPLASTSTTGRGANATLEFSPKPLGHGLNGASNSSITVTNSNWQTYRNGAGSLVPFLYDEFWGGSDFDLKNSRENSQYGGLQASMRRKVRGFSGSVNGRRADVYWPDYSSISVWFCTGVYGPNLNQWRRADVVVETEIDTNTGLSSKVLRFRLKPTRRAKTVKRLGGAELETEYEDYDELPEAVAPEVKLYLRECPESWIVSDAQSLPTSRKEAQSNRLPWWSPSSPVTRPIVDIRSGPGVPLNADLITVADPGSGWQKGTLFAFRIFQGNAYQQTIGYNTSVVEGFRNAGHTLQSLSQYVEFKFLADTPDTLTPHGPPNALITPAQVGISGSGYTNNQTGKITLYRRDLDDPVTGAVAGPTISWTAEVLATLGAATAGHIASISIFNKGRNYFSPPTIEVRGGGNGYGLSVEPQVENGRIESVRIIDPGVGYTDNPELYTSAAAADLTAVLRPALRGKYRCAFRFADRSETILKTVTATLGVSSTTLTLSDITGIEADMVLEAPQVPFNSRIKSVNGNQVEISQEIAGLAEGASFSVTVRDLTKPIAYSDLSPIKDVDCGPNDERNHASRLEWSLTGVSPPERTDMVELWRTSADQSLVFYRVEAYGIPSAEGIEIVGDDTLTDEELFDPERAHYAAIPIVLPNGNVNAYRFGKPRADMSVAVAFQDRLWMAVSTSGKDANTLFYSEFDEFESLPDVNELPIQNNQKNTDVLTALVPFGSMLLAMQHSHTYAVAYNTDPAVDATIQMMAHRGCLHQRCWDIHENVLYAADESGIYSMARNGEVQDTSLPVRDFFVSELLDFGKRDTFFLQTDPRTHIMRFFCTLKSNPTETPAFALCYDIQAKTWWTESYPNSLTAACTGRPAAARLTTMLAGAVDGGLYEIASDSDHANDSLTDTFVTDGGSGYREAPTITVPNCHGAVVQGVVSEGRLVDVVIQSAGWQASWGIGLLTEGGDSLATHEGLLLLGVDYDAIGLDVGPPEPGGVQAKAYANFSITPLVRRTCTVSEGEDFLRLKPRRIVSFEPELTSLITTEAALNITTEADDPLRVEAPAAEIGMEAIGPFIPLNAFVSRIDGPNIYLTHPDGTPAQMLFGAARIYGPPAGETWINESSQPSVTYDALGRIKVGGAPLLFWGNWLTMTSFSSVGSTPLGATRVDGSNQFLIRLSSGAATRWYLSDAWELLGDEGFLRYPGTPGYAEIEVLFRSDANGDGLVGTAGDWPDYGGTEMEVEFRKPVRTHIPFRMATGFMQLVNEDYAEGGDGLVDRSVTLVYTPTPSDKEVEIIERFNGQSEMRPNLMRRDRGGPGGFVHRQDSASTVLNTSREASHLGFATGVAKAKFASRVYTDMTGEDQHLQVELYGRPDQASPWERTNFWNPDPTIHQPHQFVLHNMIVNGVVADAE